MADGIRRYFRGFSVCMCVLSLNLSSFLGGSLGSSDLPGVRLDAD